MVSSTLNYDLKSDKLSKVDVKIGAPGISKNSTVASYEYDELGHIKSITRGARAVQVTYDYDIHGWLTSITSPNFKQKLSY